MTLPIINHHPESILNLEHGDKFLVEFKGFTFPTKVVKDFDTEMYYFAVHNPEIEQNVVIFSPLRPVEVVRKHSWAPFTLLEFQQLIISGEYCVV